MPDPVVVLDRVSKTYGKGAAQTRAVVDVSMTVDRGEWIAVMGPSGHGKSTLLQIIGGLDRPSSGHVSIDGAELGTLASAQLAALRARKIGFVFQFFNLMPHLTARENVELALWLGHAKKDGDRAMALLEQFGLADKADHRPDMLSGGQQQRVAIARALANDPDVLLMDEPTGNLDSASEQDLLALLARLHEAGKTLLMVTHSATVAKRAQRVLQVKDGRLNGSAR
ncbi:MAG: ABC transporter ATP-binding protein [Pseudomonadota bacterium]|nr:ABC transporter ATP-binding protein [Pseudomonadota bacterium]